ncbi:hypothetical protein [Pedobacter sp. B4-66]|uniref:hypothetical protein n=1 Tax=Pedobacter sp. B4-66 TaxID=2817280 RepID=UPI001BDA9A46|nr:hypothetical protein [Pedobacter sp. B4-66]
MNINIINNSEHPLPQYETEHAAGMDIRAFLLVNLSDTDFVVANGDRIAQMVIAKHETISWKSVGELSDTTRGAGGYGRTGK